MAKIIRLEPYNKLGPAPIIKPINKFKPPNKKRTSYKRTKLVDKYLIADDIANQQRFKQMFS